MESLSEMVPLRIGPPGADGRSAAPSSRSQKATRRNFNPKGQLTTVHPNATSPVPPRDASRTSRWTESLGLFIQADLKNSAARSKSGISKMQI